MQIKSQPDEIEGFLSDASNMLGGTAEKVFLPESAAEIAEVMRMANEASLPVTISGARTGTVGGAVPMGGLVISLERMNQIRSLDRDSMKAVVDPGVLLCDLQKAVESERMFYPPDPTEWSCQIGGTVATNASGARSFKYGATREYVHRLRVVLADGEEVDITRGQFVADEKGWLELVTGSGRSINLRQPTYVRPSVRKNVSGYFNGPRMDAIDLFIGSEGTLGVIAEIELDLIQKYENLFGGIVFFAKEADLLAFASEVRERSFATRAAQNGVREGITSIDASLLEYFDSRSLNFISEKFPETPAGMAGAIFFEQETSSENEDELIAGWNDVLEKHNADIDRSWFTTTDQDRERMRAFRHALPVSVNERIVRSGQRKVGTDMSVPDDRFPGFLRFYQQVLGDSGIDHVIFGHIGDCHLHANLLPKDDREAEKARFIYGRCVAQAIMLGGTVSAEHGIGKLKRKYLYAMMGERYLNEMAEIKHALDPKGILGRGNIFDESYLL